LSNKTRKSKQPNLQQTAGTEAKTEELFFYK